MPKPVHTRFRWLLTGWIFLISAIAYLDRVNISIAAKSITTDFHLTNVELGYIQSAFVLGYAFFQAPAGRLADRLGPRIVITGAFIWWAVFTALITAVPTGMAAALGVLIAIRFGLGIGEAVVYPASNTFVARWIPSHERGIANGLIFAGVGFGAGVTPPFITYLLIHHGWRASFWASAAVGLIAGAVWYVIARDSPEEHPSVSRAEAELIEAGLPQNVEKSGTARLGWMQILTDRDMLPVTFSYFAYGYAAYIFFSWFFVYLNQVRGLNLRESAWFSMLPFMAMAVGSLLGGWWSDLLTKRRGKRVGRCGMAVVGMGLAAIFIAAGTEAASAKVASVVLALGAGALYLSQSSFWSVSADIGKRSAGSVSGIMNMGGQFGGALTASLTPYIGSHAGWNPSFLVAAALCACGAVAWLVVHPEGRRSEPQPTAVSSTQSLSR